MGVTKGVLKVEPDKVIGFIRILFIIFSFYSYSN